MNYKINKVLFLSLYFFISSVTSVVFANEIVPYVVAGGIVSINHVWPKNSEFNKLSFFQQISNDGGVLSHYFWANQFYFKNGDGGYIGLQNRGNGVHAFNYSIWGAKGWSNGDCNYFGHEGDGVQCQIVVPWKTGHQYQLDILKNGNLVSGIVTDMMNGEIITVGIIEVPDTYGKLYSSFGFVEEYSQGSNQLSSCYVMGAQSSVFVNPIGDEKINAKQQTTSYGKCNDSYVVKTACTNDECINIVSNLGAIASPSAPIVPIINGHDLSHDTIYDELKNYDLVVIRSKDYSWTPNIYFPDPYKLKWKSIFVDQRSVFSSLIHVNGKATKINKGQNLMYMSNGSKWEIIN
ncbi:DUF3472 domain-containing protein [Arsenophonus nasoniae]|uniref:DUF3472 domain-containing protein n=1 Tax=Arsenophonus nasoniae TaxID=638 RepID=UPI00387A1A5A